MLLAPSSCSGSAARSVSGSACRTRSRTLPHVVAHEPLRVSSSACPEHVVILDIGGGDVNAHRRRLGGDGVSVRPTSCDRRPPARRAALRTTGRRSTRRCEHRLGPITYRYHSMSDAVGVLGRHDRPRLQRSIGSSTIPETEADHVLREVRRRAVTGSATRLRHAERADPGLQQAAFIDPDHDVEYTVGRARPQARRSPAWSSSSSRP